MTTTVTVDSGRTLGVGGETRGVPDSAAIHIASNGAHSKGMDTGTVSQAPEVRTETIMKTGSCVYFTAVDDTVETASFLGVLRTSIE